MMKVIVVMSDNRIIRQFDKNFKDAFTELGIDHKVFLVNEGKPFAKQRKYFCDLLDDFHADKILLINDLHNDAEYFVNEQILTRTQVYVWCVDTMKSNKFMNNSLAQYRGVFYFEPDDVDYCKRKYGVTLKHAVWPTCYSVYGNKFISVGPQVLSSKKYDISFVGLVSGCEKRTRILNVLAEHCSENDYKMVLYGHYWHNEHWWQRIIGGIKFRLKYPKLYKYVHNQYLTPEQAAQLYCDSRININIHVDRHSGLNIRLFDILANGNFELCDERKLEETKLIDGKHLALYYNNNDLLAKIDYYLSHEDEMPQIASAGGQILFEEYKFADALKFVLVEN